MAETLNLNVEGSITCHAWNKDKTQIAISPNSKDVMVFVKNGANWTLAQTLSEHSLKVLSIDWAPETNRIVTCGADKNAYVWSHDGKVWKPELVVLRINRAATCVKWSPNEKKFAVGCGHRCVCICYYEPDQCFWVAKHIKKQLRSTTLCLDWHPNSALIAAGGSDFKCRIFGAFVADVDGATPQPCVWGNKFNPPECVAEYSALNHGWVYSCAFSPSGNILSFVGHDSTLYMIDASRNPQEVLSVRTPYLPFLSLRFISETAVIVAGHDCFPIAFSLEGNSIRELEKLTATNKPQSSEASNAMKVFKDLDRVGVASNSSSNNSIHQNSIKQVNIINRVNSKVNKFSTCGLDGLVVIWDLSKLEEQFNKLRIK